MQNGTRPAAAPLETKAPTFNKIFRWQPADPQAAPPGYVAVVGTFSQWKPMTLQKDRQGNGWSLSLGNIPGNRTHRYMLVVDGQPVNDPDADGLAIPTTTLEKPWALTTDRGPRLFMLFGQMK